MPPCAHLALERRNGSWGRNEEHAHRLAVANLDQPGRALLVPALSGLDHAAADEVLDELPHHVSVRAQNDVIEFRVAHELECAAQPVALSQRGRLLHLEAAIACERPHRLYAAEVRARVDGGDLERLEGVDERLGLLHALLAEGTKPIVSSPVAPAAGLGVADE